MAAARSATSVGMGAGATLSARIPWSWTLREIGKVRIRPSKLRATMTDTSASNAISASARSGSSAEPPRRSIAVSTSAVVVSRNWLRPS